jgi:homoserine kinase
MAIDPRLGASKTAFAPASSANLCAGFDLLGHSVEGLGDRVTVTRTETSGIVIRSIRGCVDQLPKEPMANTAGRALAAFAAVHGGGWDVEIDKGIPLGSGLGGSAASAVAALVAANATLTSPMEPSALYSFAMEGEAAASGARHGDNVAPMLVGGLTLATADAIVALPVPDWLHSAIVRPHQTLETKRARAVLAEPFALADVVRQNEALALLIIGLERSDPNMIGRGLCDHLVAPRRSALIPGFESVMAATRQCDALGSGISGAGPSLFAWFDSREKAIAGASAMQSALSEIAIASDAFVTPVDGPAARIVD